MKVNFQIQVLVSHQMVLSFSLEIQLRHRELYTWEANIDAGIPWGCQSLKAGNTSSFRMKSKQIRFCLEVYVGCISHNHRRTLRHFRQSGSEQGLVYGPSSCGTSLGFDSLPYSVRLPLITVSYINVASIFSIENIAIFLIRTHIVIQTLVSRYYAIYIYYKTRDIRIPTSRTSVILCLCSKSTCAFIVYRIKTKPHIMSFKDSNILFLPTFPSYTPLPSLHVIAN